MASAKPSNRSPEFRFEATLGAAPRRKALAAVNELDLDRLPDVEGQVRVLITAADAARLLQQGHEVHLKAALPVRPLDANLVLTDQRAQAWLEEQLKGLPREGGR